jgi:hypothetical protein
MGCDGLSGHTVWVNFHEMCKDRVNNKLCIWPSELKMQCQTQIVRCGPATSAICNDAVRPNLTSQMRNLLLTIS